MIVDVHGHLLPPLQLYNYREYLIGTRGHYGKNIDALMENPRSGAIPPEMTQERANRHIEYLDGVGTDVQLLSMRPYTLMHSERPTKIVRWWAEAVNNNIAEQVALYPTRLQGVANLPQLWNEPIDVAFEELDRCINELGFVGVLINPDPSEGRAAGDVPGLGDPYWYPLYEKLVEYETPMFVHSCGCVSERESQSLHFINEESIAVLHLAKSDVFQRFPTLQIIVHHGGGSIPFQRERFSGIYWGDRGIELSFIESIQQMWFDTTIYSEDSMQMLFNVMGADHLVFGTERPGDGGGRAKDAAHDRDDLKYLIDRLPNVTDEDRAKVLGENALRIFPRLRKNLEAQGLTL